MSAGHDQLHTSSSEGLAVRPRRSTGLLGSPLQEARHSILTDVARGQWAFFGADGSGGGRTGGGAHRR